MGHDVDVITVIRVPALQHAGPSPKCRYPPLQWSNSFKCQLIVSTAPTQSGFQ